MFVLDARPPLRGACVSLALTTSGVGAVVPVSYYGAVVESGCQGNWVVWPGAGYRCGALTGDRESGSGNTVDLPGSFRPTTWGRVECSIASISTYRLSCGLFLAF